MKTISLLMPVYQAKDHIQRTLERTFQQTFADFELIVSDYGSTDRTIEIIENYPDKRIKLLKGYATRTEALNAALLAASGKYVAFLEAKDIMRVERLQIQHTLMQEYPELDICCSWSNLFGENTGFSTQAFHCGLIQDPLQTLLRNNFISFSSALMRKSFLDQAQVRFQEYTPAENLKYWVELAKHNPCIYVESQPLVIEQVVNESSGGHKKNRITQENRIRKEIIHHLVHQNKGKNNEKIRTFHNQACELNNCGILDDITFFNLFLSVLKK